jgi:hypothetical protein
MTRNRLTKALAGLMVIATVAFAIGAAVEKSEHHTESTATVSTEGTASGEGAAPSEGGETPSEHATETGGSETAAQHASETGNEKLLGLDPEATPLVVVAVIVSLLLAIAVWLRPDAALLLALIAVAMLVFAALDIREAVHQSDESNTGLLVLASAIAALHLAAAGLAAYLTSLTLRTRTA